MSENTFWRHFSVLDELFLRIQYFIETFGWYVVFSIIAWYVIKPYIKEINRQRTLDEIHDPKRVTILKQDMQRARIKQRVLLQAQQAQQQQELESL